MRGAHENMDVCRHVTNGNKFLANVPMDDMYPNSVEAQMSRIDWARVERAKLYISETLPSPEIRDSLRS